MSDEFDAKAHEVIDRWYEDGNDFKPNWRKSWAPLISSALRAAAEEAVKTEREAIRKDISTIELSESKDRVSPKKTYSLGDLWEAYYTGAHALHNAVIDLIRARGMD